MLYLSFEIEYTGLLAAPSKWKTIKKDAYKEAGRFWHKSFAAKHFTNDGAKKYGYRRRTTDYVKKKWREKKHGNPLVWSGKTKSDVLNKWRVQGKRGGGAEVIMNARGLNRRPARGKIRMRKEMETVLPAEVKQMAARAGKRANRDLANLPRKKRRRKRIGA